MFFIFLGKGKIEVNALSIRFLVFKDKAENSIGKDNDNMHIKITKWQVEPDQAALWNR